VESLDFLIPESTPVEFTDKLNAKLALAQSDKEKEHIINMALWDQVPAEKLASTVSGAFSSMIPALVATYVTKNPEAFFATMVAQSSASQYQQTFENQAEGKKGLLGGKLDKTAFGLDEEAQAIGMGLFTYASEKFFNLKAIEGLLAPVVHKTLGNFVKATTGQGGKEALQEVSEQLYQNITEILGSDDGQVVYANLLDAAVGGMGAGAGRGLFSNSLELAREGKKEVTKQRNLSVLDGIKDSLIKNNIYDADEANTAMAGLYEFANKYEMTEDQLKSIQLQFEKEGTISNPQELNMLVTERFAKARADGVLATSLKTAKESLSSGVKKDRVWAETGWWNSPAGWLFEIPPESVKIDVSKKTGPLTELVEAPELFAGAPYLKDITVEFLSGSGQKHAGSYDFASATIRVNSLLSPQEQEAANLCALEYLNKWMADNGRSKITLEEAYSGDRQSDIY